MGWGEERLMQVFFLAGRCEIKIRFLSDGANSWFAFQKRIRARYYSLLRSGNGRRTVIPNHLLRLTHAGQTACQGLLGWPTFAALAVSSGLWSFISSTNSISVPLSLTGLRSIMQQDSTWLHNADSSTAAAVAHFWRRGAHIWGSGL